MTDIERNCLFSEVFNQNKQHIYRLLTLYFSDKDIIDDVFQEVVICIWKNLHTFKWESKISTWIYRITVNNALLYSKKHKKADSLFTKIDEASIADTSFEELESAKEEKAKLDSLRRLITSLDPQDRLIISLYLEDVSYKEIAGIIGITVNYLGVRINRIKTILEKGVKRNEC